MIPGSLPRISMLSRHRLLGLPLALQALDVNDRFPQHTSKLTRSNVIQIKEAKPPLHIVSTGGELQTPSSEARV